MGCKDKHVTELGLEFLHWETKECLDQMGASRRSRKRWYTSHRALSKFLPTLLHMKKSHLLFNNLGGRKLIFCSPWPQMNAAVNWDWFLLVCIFCSWIIKCTCDFFSVYLNGLCVKLSTERNVPFLFFYITYIVCKTSKSSDMFRVLYSGCAGQNKKDRYYRSSIIYGL